MNTPEEQAAWIQKKMRESFWQGFVIGASVMLIVWSTCT